MLTDEEKLLIRYPFLPGLKEAVKQDKVEITPEKIKQAGQTAKNLLLQTKPKIEFNNIQEAAEQTIILKIIFKNLLYYGPRLLVNYYVNKITEDEQHEKLIEKLFEELPLKNLFQIIDETDVELYELSFEKGELKKEDIEKKYLIQKYIEKYYFTMIKIPDEIREEIGKEIEIIKNEIKTNENIQITQENREFIRNMMMQTPETSKLNHSCIKKIMEGLPEGKRYYGCYALCIACFADNLSIEQAVQILREYVKKCTGTSEYSEKEALATLNWVYKREITRLPCRMLFAQGIITEKCEYIRYR